MENTLDDLYRKEILRTVFLGCSVLMKIMDGQ